MGMNLATLASKLPPSMQRAAVSLFGQHSALFRMRLRAKGLHKLPIPAPTLLQDEDTRVYIAPLNVAGQARLWASALNTHCVDTSAAHMMAPAATTIRLTSDRPVPLGAFHLSREWQRNEFSVAQSATHVLNESLRPMFGGLYGYQAEREIRALRAQGVSVAVLAHGSDFRSPALSRSRTPWSPFHNTEHQPEIARLQQIADSNMRRLRDLDVSVFVSTPDQLADIPEAVWVPLVVDATPWVDASQPLRIEGRPRVTHVPSKGWLKGTGLIAPAMESLASRGVVDYHPLSGLSHDQMPAALGSADIVLEQFGVGSYGVTAVEAMASGRVVVAHILPDVRDHIRSLTGLDLPIVEATPVTLEETIASLAADPERRLRIGAASQEFASAVHGGQLSARSFSEHWLNAGPVNRP
ncbi:glycosyltransferase [Leucobacter sp. G161]|uniref:glycosyltransferase n=1 Tax=Leucobacter sp. G161 TaxID=663704 RepID=UPI00073B4454|nr:glycosyltransferase [Leucobacter sp. G161]KUF08398.1 hypothetical protein AUL38_05170 [Leucobacter sp. G161]